MMIISNALLLLLGSYAFGGEQVQVKVKGMVCSFCSQGITKKFKAEPAVKTVNVDLETHLVSLELKDGEKLEDGTLQKVLTDAGYTIDKIERK
jgi:periplasmic mercuric ion binding protein